MSVTDLADGIHMTRQMLQRILSERASVTPEMAVRLGAFCGNGPNVWLRMQAAHDLWHAQNKLAAEVKTTRKAKLPAQV